MTTILPILMTIDVQIQIERLPNDEWQRKVVPMHRRIVYVGGDFVHTKVVDNRCTARDDASM